MLTLQHWARVTACVIYYLIFEAHLATIESVVCGLALISLDVDFLSSFSEK